MDIRNAVENDAKVIAKFIAGLNTHKQHHIGYVGDKEDEILDSLQEEFMEGGDFGRLITLLYENDMLVGVLGLNADFESGIAEMWGPYTTVSDDKYMSAALGLWNHGIHKLDGEIQEYHGFFNRENVNGLRFMESLKAEKKGTHLIMKGRKQDSPFETSSFVQEITPEFMKEFVKLHDTVFSDTYYDGNKIESLLNEDEHNKLLIYEKDGRLAGYCYIEGNPEFQEGNIEYIAVADSFRKQGIGKSLLYAGLNHLFFQLDVEEIAICVDGDNLNAVKLYEAAGFDLDNVLDFYKYTRV